MDIVDNNMVINKCNNHFMKRHISYVNNITNWLKLDVNYIKKENKLIINRYKKILNQKDVKTLIKCIKININIVPILYHLNTDDIKILIKNSLDYKCIKMLTYVNRLLKQYFQSGNSYVYQQACYNGCLNIIKFLCKNIGLAKKDLQLKNNFACKLACKYGHINIVKYLHRHIGLTKEDYISSNNYACQMACKYNHINVVKYLHQRVGLTIQNFQSDHNYALEQAYRNKHVDIIRYLHEEIGLHI